MSMRLKLYPSVVITFMTTGAKVIPYGELAASSMDFYK